MTSAKNMFTKTVSSKPEEKAKENLLVQAFKKRFGKHLIIVTNQLAHLENYTNQCRTLFLATPAITESETKLPPTADPLLPNKKTIDAALNLNATMNKIKKLLNEYLCNVIHDHGLTDPAKIKSPRTIIRDKFLLFEETLSHAIPLITSEEVYRTAEISHGRFCDLIINECDELFFCIYERAEKIETEMNAIVAIERRLR